MTETLLVANRPGVSSRAAAPPVRTRIAWLIAVALAAAGCGTVRVPAGSPDYFPMQRGVRWTYALHREVGTTRGTVATNDTVVRCEALKAVVRPELTAALFSALPTSIDPWSETNGAASPVVLVQIADSQYHLLDTDALARCGDPEDALQDLIRGDSLFLDTPLVAGKRYGDFAQLTRPDGFYCWFVRSEARIRIRGVDGVSPWRRHVVYQLVHRSLPDVREILFAPGIGILEYTYHHNGTACDLRMKLQRFEQRVDPEPLRR